MERSGRLEWPGQFPGYRVLIAFLVIPIFSMLAFLMDNQIWLLTHPSRGMEKPALWDWSWIGFAVVFSWPGYLVFLVLGIPTLYVLYRRKETAFALFALIGMVYAFLPAVVAGLTVRPFVPHVYLSFLMGECVALGLIGVIDGILVRLIVLDKGGRTARVR